jgi:predicted 2-oxoglutarate/Fe(II)-dependent dioxygenase YbiX/peroxiredoxin
MTSVRYRELQPGDPAPWFTQRCTSNERYAFDTVAGRYIALCFFGSAGHASGQARLAHVLQTRSRFDDRRLAFFGVSVDPADEASGRVREALPGIRHFWDADRRVSRLFGALPAEAGGNDAEEYRPRWVLLNPDLGVRRVIHFRADRSDLEEFGAAVAALPAVEHYAGVEVHAPVMLLPGIFDAALCRELVALYERHGGEISGHMVDEGGRTVGVYDASHKVRRDRMIEDAAVKAHINGRIGAVVAPAIARAYHFSANRMERYVVACYDSADQAHFRAHRDNTTRGTAHRRFALSINLNDDFEGGELGFPEFGPRRYKPPAGCGVVFSCSLLHAVSPVRSGRRFAFLPFLYDDAAAALREAHSDALGRG